MYRFRKENWVKKVDASFPKHWSKSNQEYGFFMEQPRHLTETQYYETHSDLIKRSPYAAVPVPRAHMSVADTAPTNRMRKNRQRVGVYYDYDDKNDMWDVLKHKENPPAPRKILTRSPMRLPPLGRSKTRMWDPNQIPQLNTQWFKTQETASVSQSPDYSYDHPRHPAEKSAISRQSQMTDYSRAKTPAYNREITMGPRLRTVGPREDHGIGGGRPRTSRGSRATVQSDVDQRSQLPFLERNPTGFFRSHTPFDDQSYAASNRPKSRYYDSRSLSPPRTAKGRRATMNERFFHYNFHPQWKSALHT